MYLYFEHSDGSLSFITECAREEAPHQIVCYINEAYPDYKIYYIRSWGSEEEGYTYDVGSHTEFFRLYNERLSES